MSQFWTSDIVNALRQTSACPRCSAPLTQPGWCVQCGADLRGAPGIALHEVSVAAAEAIERRQTMIDQLPTVTAPAAAAAAAATLAASAPAWAGQPQPGQAVPGQAVPSQAQPAQPIPGQAFPGQPGQPEQFPGQPFADPSGQVPPQFAPGMPGMQGMPIPVVPPRTSSISLQSVLAVAGAALVAVAGLVFTFLNPDLTDFATRTTIVAVITAVFLGSAWLMTRAKLQFSAEAIGGLGMVFVALDVWAFSTLAVPGVSEWVLGGIGVLVSSAALIALGFLIRLRTWVWMGAVGLLITPSMFSFAGPNGSVAFGFLGVLAVGIAIHELAPRVGSRFQSTLPAERIAASVLQIIAALYLVGEVAVFSAGGDRVLETVYRVVLLLLFTGLSAVAARYALQPFWTWVSAVTAVSTVMVVAFSFTRLDLYWVAVVPAAGALALAGLAAMPFPRWMNRTVALVGGWTPLLAIGLAPMFTSLANIGPRYEFARVSDGIVGAIGVTIVGAGSAALWALARRRDTTAGLARVALVASLWIGGLALFLVTTWNGLPPVAQVLVGLLAALGLSLVVTRVPQISLAPVSVRSPLIAGAHILLPTAVILAGTESWLIIPGGVAVLATQVMVARTVPHPARVAHLTLGYTYALCLFAYGMSQLQLEGVAVQCLTTALAALVALAATLVRRLRAASWWAILGVTVVPFLIGIASVIAVRSGWTALSTTVMCALAITLLVTQRPGLTTVVRGMAASLIVPSLAVIVVSLGAQVLPGSASPVTLPVIAVIVGVVLPLTDRIRMALTRLGIAEESARVARLAIEISALVTAAIAVILALSRTAAGLGTTVVVFLILGLGAAATGLFAHRRYAWTVTWISFTGALWSFLALSSVQIVEPYVLPPTLAAALVAAILAGRGRGSIGIPARTLYSLALVIAPLPTLGFLTFWGAGADGSGTWRAPALLAASVILIALTLVLPRFTQRLVPFQLPTLGVAALTALAGAFQAVRLGWGLDVLPVDPSLLMGVALGFSLVSALLVGLAGRIAASLPPESVTRRVLDPAAPPAPAGTPAYPVPRPQERTITTLSAATRFAASRWLYAPALVLLVLGPITAVQHTWFAIWTLWALAMALLGLMIATAAHARTHPVVLPPVWFTFVLAWVTAVTGWSERELRVETFSLPLGLALLAVGIIGMTQTEAARASRGSLASWPIGFQGSWRLLAPGLLVTFVPSMLSTATDPLTWRAILVLALALIAIFVGSLRRLGAPFIIGLIVLPLENIIVFAVQIGRSIGATPWWITLATVGAVLLVLAVTSERRTEGKGGAAVRMRDLR